LKAESFAQLQSFPVEVIEAEESISRKAAKAQRKMKFNHS